MLLGLDLRLWLMILGPVFIGVILLQGYFRVRGKKGDEIQLSLDKNYKSSLGENDNIDELSLLKAELPNGGARIVSPPEQTSMSLDVPISAKPETVQKSAKPLKRTKKAREIPMLMELADNQNIDEPPVQTSLSMNLLLEEAVGENQISSAGSEQEVDSDSTMTSESAEEASSDFKIVPEQKQEPETSFTMPPEPEPESEPGFTIPSEPVQASGPDFTISSEPEQEPGPAVTISPEPEQEPEPDSSISISSEPNREVQVSRNVEYSAIEKLVIVYVMAKQGNFSGEELRQVLQDNGMVYGDMKIFHRMSREGLSEFSLSSAVEPGFFDIARMDNLQTPGVIMFLRVHELADPMSVYGEMMNVAISIAEKLDGVVLDETRNSMTMQTIEYCKQSIRDFQFRHSA